MAIGQHHLLYCDEGHILLAAGDGAGEAEFDQAWSAPPSTNSPVSIRPPDGAWVLSAKPAACIAALLAIAAWPSTRPSHTSQSLAHRIRSRRRSAGSACQPTTPGSSGAVSSGRGVGGGIGFQARLKVGEREGARKVELCSAVKPSAMTWPCASVGPAVQYRPSASTTLVSRSFSISPCSRRFALAVVADQDAGEPIKLGHGHRPECH